MPVDQLTDVSGIGPAKLDAIRDLVTDGDRANPSGDAQYSDSPRITVAAINAPAAPIATPTNIRVLPPEVATSPSASGVAA